MGRMRSLQAFKRERSWGLRPLASAFSLRGHSHAWLVVQGEDGVLGNLRQKRYASFGRLWAC